ncbi:aspartyl aminopeptidase, partial [Lecanoromycetidae sp. Uapishka_2]
MGVSAQAGHELLSFINASPTPFHAVHNVKQRLEKAGFKHLDEKDPWAKKCVPGGKYYLTRNTSTILAFAIGQKWKAGNPIAMIGAHTDSCALRIKPVSKKQSDGFIQVGVETYGGGLWHTWFDRDLSIAGRVMVKDQQGSFVQKLVKVDRPILRIPTLAIHLDRQEKFEFNKETQLFPIAGLIAAELNRQGKSGDRNTPESTREDDDNDDDDEVGFHPLKVAAERHHPYIVELIAKEANVDSSEVVDFEMILYDTQKSCVGGLNEELLFSARLDNLGMSFCSTMGLMNSVSASTALDDEESIRLISLFDHEEIGSNTAQGADSNFLPTMVRRLSSLSMGARAEPDADAYEQTLSKSFLISADMAHSVNPNYSSKYESDHKPEMNKGSVIKINANARYATNSPGVVLVEEAARRAKVPLQLFVVRNDSSCGSTIGPMLSAALGTRTLDIGNPQLSMHSIRETGGVYDVEYGIKLFESFFEHYSELEKKFVVD